LQRRKQGTIFEALDRRAAVAGSCGGAAAEAVEERKER
jgi:hypothetical protein